MIQFPSDPYFDETAVENRIKNLWMQLFAARASWDPEPLKPYFSARLYGREEAMLREDRKAGRVRQSYRPAILRRSISCSGEIRGREILVCRLFTRYRPLLVDKATGKILSGGQEKFFREDWTLSRPAGNRTPQPGAAITVNCPGCGYPLSLYKTAKCPFCGTLTRVPDFTWSVDDIAVRVEDHP